MDLSRSALLVPRLEVLEQAASTNDVLVDAAVGPDAADWPDLSVVVTDNQTMGRGRLGRIWMAPEGKSLAISVLVRPARRPAHGPGLPIERFGWLPLIAGAAMTRAVRAVVEPFAERQAAAAAAAEIEPAELEVSLKWPNDVLVAGYKVSGILAELLPDAAGVVIGAGLNLALDEHDLPTETSTSLKLVTGAAPDPDAVLADYLAAFAERYRALGATGGDPVASGIAGEVRELCGSIGRQVRVELPGGAELIGRALDIDVEGRLVVEDRENGEPQAVAAGDVTHLRY